MGDLNNTCGIIRTKMRLYTALILLIWLWDMDIETAGKEDVLSIWNGHLLRTEKKRHSHSRKDRAEGDNQKITWLHIVSMTAVYCSNGKKCRSLF